MQELLNILLLLYNNTFNDRPRFIFEGGTRLIHEQPLS